MARLAAGVRKKDSGRYEKRFTVDGKRYSVSGTSSRECIQKEQEIRQQLAEGSYSSNKKITLSEYFEEWQKTREKIIKESTANNVRRRFRKHIEPVLGKCRIVEIEKRQIQNLQKKLSSKLKPTTVNLVITKTLLGHSSLAMTADLYSHVLPNTKQKEMDMISSVFEEAADL